MKKIILTNEQIDAIGKLPTIQVSGGKDDAETLKYVAQKFGNDANVSMVNDNEEQIEEEILAATSDPDKAKELLDNSKIKSVQIRRDDKITESYSKSEVENMRLQKLLENSTIMSKKQFNDLLLK